MQYSYTGMVNNVGSNGLFGIPSLIGSGLDFVGGLFHNAQNRKIAEQNMQLQRDINSQNIAFQQRENEITREREDNAVQRAAADMSAAGLSKTLAAGQPASAAALSAPHAGNVSNEFKYESALQKLNLGEVLLDMQSKKQSLDIERGLADANIKKIDSETARNNIDNSHAEERFEMEKTLNDASVRSYEISNELKSFEFRLKEQYGGEEMLSKIDNLVADTRYKNMSTREKSHNISEIIARTNNINESTKKLVEDIAYRKLEIDSLKWNLDYSKEHYMRTNDTAQRILGFNMTSFGDSLKEGLNLDPDSFAGKMWHNLNSPIWKWKWPF